MLCVLPSKCTLFPITVKTAQIISSRRDLFPEQYTDALSGFTDNLDPMPASLAKAVVKSELLHADERFEDVFCEFDETPLGAASVAQVHRAVLTEKYGGREVAVKIQRPSIESKLMGDIANLKAITKTFRNAPQLPLDYYTVFSELEKQLRDEFDFVAEAAAMDRIYASLHAAPDGSPRPVPLVLPRPVPGLVSRRVLVQDFLRGVPLSRAGGGVDPESPAARLFGRQLLRALTECFGRNILETGFFHAGACLFFISFGFACLVVWLHARLVAWMDGKYSMDYGLTTNCLFLPFSQTPIRAIFLSLTTGKLASLTLDRSNRYRVAIAKPCAKS